VLGEDAVGAGVLVVNMPEVVVDAPDDEPQPIGVRAIASTKRHGKATTAIFLPNFMRHPPSFEPPLRFSSRSLHPRPSSRVALVEARANMNGGTSKK